MFSLHIYSIFPVHRDIASGQTKVNDTATLEYMKNTFTAHYTGNRQPIGLYTHPIHLSVSPMLSLREAID